MSWKSITNAITPGMGSVIGGVASGIGSIAGGIFSANSADKAVKKQIAWERERATNAHQWEVQDLIKAGLNPVLSAGGSGATTGGVSAPLPDWSGVTNAGTNIMNAINTAFEAAVNQSLIGKTGAETNNITQDTKNKMTAQELMQKQIINEALRGGLISAQTANMEFKNLTEKYRGERAALSFWNDELYKASNTAKNAADIGFGAIKRFIPQKHRKEMDKTFGDGWTHTSMSEW